MLERFLEKTVKHYGFRRYFFNTGWSLFGQVFTLLISFFIGAWVAKYLGPYEYGRISYVVAFTGLFAFLAGMGLDSILSREIINHPEKKGDLLGSAFFLRILGSLLAIVLVTIFSFYLISDTHLRYLVIIYSSSLIIQCVGVISIYFQSQVQAWRNVRVQVISTIISSVLKIIFITLGLGLPYLVFIYVLDFFWQSAGLIWSYRLAGGDFKFLRFNKSLAISLFKSSWPLMFSGGIIFVYLRIDQILIGKILGEESLGIYSIAIKLSEIWYFIPTVICASLFPAIINAKKSHQKSFQRRLHNLYLLMFALAGLSVVFTYVFSEKIIILLFGNQFFGAANILKIYILSNFGMFLSSAISQYFIAENLIKISFLLNLVIMVLNVSLNLIFIPIFNLSGAAMATLISYSFLPVLAWIFSFIVKKRLSF